MDDEREYTDSEKAAYEPPPCPECDQHSQRQLWAESTAMGTNRRWRPTITKCTNSECPRNNR